LRDTHVLVEVKARVKKLETVRRKLMELNAKHVGTFHQTDTYFEVPRGRLKIRETSGRPQAQLIYYERENTKGPKKSEAFILQIDQPTIFKAAIKKLLKIKATVHKTREIYEFKGIKIHLDEVENLGKFVELEKLTERDEDRIREDREILEKFLESFGITRADLERLSYGELMREKQPPQN